MEKYSEKGLLKELERLIRIADECVLDDLDRRYLIVIMKSTINAIDDTCPIRSDQSKKGNTTSEIELLRKLEKGIRSLIFDSQIELSGIVGQSKAILDALAKLRQKRAEQAIARQKILAIKEIKRLFEVEK